jgi:hypothetical protein
MTSHYAIAVIGGGLGMSAGFDARWATDTT